MIHLTFVFLIKSLNNEIDSLDSFFILKNVFNLRWGLFCFNKLDYFGCFALLN